MWIARLIAGVIGNALGAAISSVLTLFVPSKGERLVGSEAREKGLEANVEQVKKADAAIRRGRRDPAERVRLRRKARNSD